MADSRLVVKKGMYVILKDDISESLSRYGSNREKRRYGGQIRQVTYVTNGGLIVYLKRHPHEKSFFRNDKSSWKFHLNDIEEIVDMKNIKNVKKEEYSFDPQQLVTY